MDAETSPSAPPTVAVALARDIAAHLADGVTDPAEMLALLHAHRSYQWLTLRDCARQMRALTGDTRQIARGIAQAKSAEMMLDVIEHGEPKDKIQVLAKWGPAVNDDERGGGLTIIVGPSSNVQVNIGLSPQQSKALGESDRNR